MRWKVRTHCRAAALSAIALAICSSGCGGSDGPETVNVTGTVRLDGVQVPSGQVVFSDPAGVVGASAGSIEEGAFSFPSTLGRKKVSITSPQEVKGARAPVGGIEGDPISEANPAVVIAEMIPERYNAATELEVEVKPDGPNEFTFDLKTK